MPSVRSDVLALSLLVAVSLIPTQLSAQNADGTGAGPAIGTLVAPTAPAFDSTSRQGTLSTSQPIAVDWRVPIHSLPADPVGGAYGTWAAGQTFKASFHDGFAFYPFLGPDYPHNLPVRWTTESVTAGGEPCVDCAHAPRHAQSSMRYEYHFEGMTEAYDVLDDGVEQSFRLTRRPNQAGDLVVTGRVTTELTAPVAAAAHQPIVFVDHDGKALVRYGEAFAIDANGQRFDVATAYDGSRLRLIVPAAAVAAAVFPLVVDPLLARVAISTGSSGSPAVHPSVARDDESTTANVMTVYSRQFSSTDYDGYARLTDDDFSNSTSVFTDITASWSTDEGGASFVGAADRWVLCVQRLFPAVGTARVRVLFHDKGNTTLNSGVLVNHDPNGGEVDWWPAIGGTAGFSTTGVNALLVYQADVSSSINDTPNSEVYAVLCNASTRTLGTRFEIDNGVLGADNDKPDVNRESAGGTTSWVVAYEQYNNLLVVDDVDIQVARVTSTGIVAGHAFVGPGSGTPTHKLAPQIGGRDGRYCVSMLRSDQRSSLGSEIVVERFDWSESAATPTKLGPLTLDASAPANFFNGDIAYDDNSESHWTLVYMRNSFITSDCHALRVGFTGAQTEVAQLSPGSYVAWPAVTFNDDADEFLCVYSTIDGTLYGQRFVYPTAAVNVLYGTGCGPGTISATAPYAGSQYFQIGLGGVPLGTVAVMIACAGPSSIPLGAIGMTGCTSLIDTNAQFGSVIVVTPGSAGFALPDNPVFVGDVYAQWIYFDSGLNPAGLGASAALRIQVR